MGEVVSVGSGALEELRERLLRWDELCAQLRELYYRYLDLAAFRSDKCYFPGRKCKRSWKREYDAGDLTLMWTYIANTAPLCGKLMRALAEVEYRIRKSALESLEKYGSREKRTKAKSEMLHQRLNKPIFAYLALWNKRLYVVWHVFDGLPKKGKLRAAEIEQRVADLVERYNYGKNVDVQMDVFDVEDEYRRLWLEVPLPESVSKLFGRRTKAPVALFRNLGWLLSDDGRVVLRHDAGNLGQMAIRLFDWIALAKYAIDVLKIAPNKPLIFRITVRSVSRTKDGDNPIIEIQPIGATAKIIKGVYELFGITLGKSEEVILRGYTTLKILKEETFRRERGMYVVNDVYTWIAFSNIVNILIIGDGNINTNNVWIAAKDTHKATLEGVTTRAKELAEALNGIVYGGEVKLQTWHMRLLLPTPPTPAFEKTVKLYDVLTNYFTAVAIEINGTTYLLTCSGGRNFIIGKGKAATLYEVAKSLGVKMYKWGAYYAISITQLKELSRRGVLVRFLNDLEKEAFREVKAVLPLAEQETIRQVLMKVAEMARIYVGLHRGQEFIRIIPHDKSKLEEIAKMLIDVGIRGSIISGRKEIWIYEKTSVQIICNIISHIFSDALTRGRIIVDNYPPSLHFFCQSGADAVKSGKSIVLHGGYPALDVVEPAVKIHIGLNAAFYRVFRISICVQDRFDKFTI